jgi:hypothetical protein
VTTVAKNASIVPMGPVIRPLVEADWAQVTLLPDAILTGRPAANAAWLRNVRSFDGERARYVMILHTRIMGFGSIERADSTGVWRIRVLMRGPDIASGHGLPLVRDLIAALRARSAAVVWDRVDLDEPELLALYQAHGFVIDEAHPVRYDDDHEYLTVRRRL